VKSVAVSVEDPSPSGIAGAIARLIASGDLAPGDRIVLYTDGITEAQNGAQEFFGRKRLREAVRHAGSANCIDLHRAIQQAVLDFTAGAEQADDLTLVVVEYSGGRRLKTP